MALKSAPIRRVNDPYEIGIDNGTNGVWNNEVCEEDG